MARVCEITGKRARVGNNVSHANNKTKRKFYPNLQKKKFYLEEEGVWVSIKLSTKALRTINKIGLQKTLKKAAQKGTLA
jgi:large subunit ribosomal protein L28